MTVTVSIGNPDPTLTAKAALVFPAATSTGVGTATPVMLLVKLTDDPPCGAGLLIVILQEPVPGDSNDVELQDTADRAANEWLPVLLELES